MGSEHKGLFQVFLKVCLEKGLLLYTIQEMHEKGPLSNMFIPQEKRNYTWKMEFKSFN